MVVLRVAFYRKGMRRKSFVVLVAIRTCQLAKNKNAAGAQRAPAYDDYCWESCARLDV